MNSLFLDELKFKLQILCEALDKLVHSISYSVKIKLLNFGNLQNLDPSKICMLWKTILNHVTSH